MQFIRHKHGPLVDYEIVFAPREHSVYAEPHPADCFGPVVAGRLLIEFAPDESNRMWLRHPEFLFTPKEVPIVPRDWPEGRTGAVELVMKEDPVPGVCYPVLPGDPDWPVFRDPECSIVRFEHPYSFEPCDDLIAITSGFVVGLRAEQLQQVWIRIDRVV